jgi:hypothetical protein
MAVLKAAVTVQRGLVHRPHDRNCGAAGAAHFALGLPTILAVTVGAVTLGLAVEIFWAGLKAGLVTFGGAYTVIPYLHDVAVDSKHRLSQNEFVDGLAMSGVLPAPLIIFSTFVGYIAGGLTGALVMTLGIFRRRSCSRSSCTAGSSRQPRIRAYDRSCSASQRASSGSSLQSPSTSSMRASSTCRRPFSPSQPFSCSTAGTAS